MNRTGFNRAGPKFCPVRSSSARRRDQSRNQSRIQFMVLNSIQPETLRLLVVSQESAVLRAAVSLAESRGWHVQTAANGWDAMERVEADAPHMLLLDVPEGDSDSLRLLPWLRRICPEVPAVVVCYADDSSRQEEAIRQGAREVLARPLRESQLESVIQRHLDSGNPNLPNHDLPNHNAELEMASENIERLGEDEFFLSISSITQKLRAQAELLAQTDVPVLILGEKGSGKGTVARLIHRLSVYSGFNFLRVNCAETPADLLEIELFGRGYGSAGGNTKRRPQNASQGNGRTLHGKLEMGEKGTLLLDEVTEMPLALQARLLQLLQEKRFVRSGDAHPVAVDVRILAASSGNVDRALAEKRLRADLYYRLSAFTMQVPPLRQRKEEIKVLLRYCMHKLARYYGLPAREFSSSTLAACQNHNWPGNLAELESFVKRYLVAGDSELARSAGPQGFDLHLHGWHQHVAQQHDWRQHDRQQNGTPGNAPGDRPSIPSLKLAAAAPPEEMEGSELPPKSLKSLVQSVKGEAERNAIAAALQKTGWNRKAAARLLGVSYRTMLYKIEQYNMNASEHYFSSLAPTRLSDSGPVAVAEGIKGDGKAS